MLPKQFIIFEIEGIYNSDEQVKQIVQDKTMPKTRDEQEIAGYRDVLNTIHHSYDQIAPKPSNILLMFGIERMNSIYR